MQPPSTGRKGDEDLMTGLPPDINPMEMVNEIPTPDKEALDEGDSDVAMSNDDDDSESADEEDFDDAAEMEAIETICGHRE